jgi:nitroimidazol reductase NimA-like FMN-containing flavoprotein (pyridoxamine 5'-phosphate oxidase superfamily)
MTDLTARAKEIIEQIVYITIASSSRDGQPWNSPVYSAHDDDYNFYWASDKNGQHSKNIRDNPNVFIVIYDSTVPPGAGEGVYCRAEAYELTNQNEVSKALGLLYRRQNQKPRSASEFANDYPRRVYKAVPQQFWMNGDGEVNGNFIDIRTEVNLKN